MECTLTKMVRSTRAFGRKTNSMAKAKRPGRMGLSIKAITCSGRSTVWARSSGAMGLSTQDNSTTTTSKARANISGLMVAALMAAGRTTKWTAEASSHGLMKEGTRVTISKIKSRARGPSVGLMADAISDSGRTESSTGRESLWPLTGSRGKASGPRARDCGGLTSDILMLSIISLRRMANCSQLILITLLRKSLSASFPPCRS